MNPQFKALREQARKRRDATLAAARADYETTMQQIAALELRLSSKPAHTKRPAVAAAVQAVMPADAPFTSVDIHQALEAQYPDQVWLRKSINTCLGELVSRGTLKRIRRPTIHNHAVYAFADLNVTVDPGENMTLHDAIRLAVTRPMTSAEVVNAVLATGYKTIMSPRMLREVLCKEMRALGFVRDGERWASASERSEPNAE